MTELPDETVVLPGHFSDESVRPVTTDLGELRAETTNELLSYVADGDEESFVETLSTVWPTNRRTTTRSSRSTGGRPSPAATSKNSSWDRTTALRTESAICDRGFVFPKTYWGSVRPVAYGFGACLTPVVAWPRWRGKSLLSRTRCGRRCRRWCGSWCRCRTRQVLVTVATLAGIGLVVRWRTGCAGCDERR